MKEKQLGMKKIVYESPTVEMVELQTQQAVLLTSLTGESINDWEDM